ncbi:MAG TPA: BPSS1780 family membrane protein [Saprospiraceae bacterium]|nr:BPSS1780 family membrane protein [Saprospiraceae bacterium]
MHQFEKKDFSISTYFSEGITLFKKNPWIFIGFTLVYFIVNMVVAFIPVLGTIATSLFTFAFFTGFFILANKAERDEELTLAHGFEGFKKLTPLLMLGLIYLGVTVLFVLIIGGTTLLPAILGNSSDPLAILEAFKQNGVFLFVAIFIFAFIALFALVYAPMFIYFKNESPLDSIKSSFNLALKNPLKLILMIILGSILVMISAILLVLPMFAAIPVLYNSIYAAWKDQSGYTESEGGNYNIIDNLV